MHEFQAVEPGVPQCAHTGPSGVECGMGPNHRLHRTVAARPAPPRPAGDTPAPAAAAATDDPGVVLGPWALPERHTPKGRVFAAIGRADVGGMTDDELFRDPQLSDMGPNTIRPRRAELEDDGLVRKSRFSNGDLVKRPTTTGQPAQVWVLSPAAQATYNRGSLVGARPGR